MIAHHIQISDQDVACLMNGFQNNRVLVYKKKIVMRLFIVINLKYKSKEYIHKFENFNNVKIFEFDDCMCLLHKDLVDYRVLMTKVQQV